MEKNLTTFTYTLGASLVAQMVKNDCNAEDPGSVPELGRSTGEGNGSPLQYCSLENSIDNGIWWATWDCKEPDTTEQLHFTLQLIGSTTPRVYDPRVWSLFSQSRDYVQKHLIPCTKAPLQALVGKKSKTANLSLNLLKYQGVLQK